nr:immunoglobulin heavy chain junction region [Mus musculus]
CAKSPAGTEAYW